MKKIKYICLFILALSSGTLVLAQNHGYVQYTKLVTNKPILLDSLSVLPSSLSITINNQSVPPASYTFDVLQNTVLFQQHLIGEIAHLSFKRLTWNWQQDVYLLDTNIIEKPITAPFSFRAEKTGNRISLYKTDELQKQGSISRAVVIGNGQNTSVNSDLNLQITGKLTDNISVRANITDRSIPVQPEGNTQNIQEFDQVFIELWNDNNRLKAGDFESKGVGSYFLKYQKRMRGVLLETNTTQKNAFTSKIGGAISRGKFSRNVIPGIENNQGPYRLKGAEGELFILVLAGTERVFLNGVSLERGLDRDYVIDYNNAEISFTANTLITKDSRITVEFQYADQQYTRVLLLGEQEWKNTDWKVYSKYYQEQDAKNQPLQIDLTPAIKEQISNAGDPNVNEPLLVSSSQNIGYNDALILYAIIDTLGYSSIYRYSTNPDSAFYAVGFSKVPLGQGDYVLISPLSNGKTHQWIAPDTIAGVIVNKGDYVALRQVTPPQKQILWVNGFSLDKNGWELGGEIAYSNHDLNTFSNKEDGDNQGIAYLLNAHKNIRLNSNNSINARARFEHQESNFNPIERFRVVEFERDWNLQQVNSQNTQLTQFESGIGYEVDSLGVINTGYQQLKIDSVVNAHKIVVDWKLKNESFSSTIQGSWLKNKSNQQYFIRHIGKHEKYVGKFSLTYEDEREENAAFIADSLSAAAYQFYWYRVGSSYRFDPNKNIKLFAGQRADRISNGHFLAKAAKANEAGMSFTLNDIKNQDFTGTVQFRELTILDTALIAIEPESTLLWQFQQQGDLAKGFFNQRIFMEYGSGLERKKTFQYIEVPIGQGVYAHTDFNNNNIKELDEFYVSPFPYEANYLKVYLPTQDYVKARSGRLNYTLNIQPSVVWINKKGVKKWISKLSTQHVLGYFNKTKSDEVFTQLFKSDKSDDLLSKENNQSHYVHYNQFSQVFGMIYNYAKSANVQLLMDGFQERNSTTHTLTFRKNWKSFVNSILIFKAGKMNNISDLLTQQNYAYQLRSVEPEINTSLNKKTSLIANGRYLVKKAETMVYIGEVTLGLQYIHSSTGNHAVKLGVVNTSKPDITNNALKLELLEGYSPGVNYTWSVNSQQQVAENLQLNISYQARANKNSPTIHVGTVQVRAYF